MLGSLWRGYSRLLLRKPLITKTVTGCSMYLCGDFTMQKIEVARAKKQNQYDVKRTIRMCLYGGVWMAPFLHFWYAFLDRALKRNVMLKLLVDQTVAAPINVLAFYSITTLLETFSFHELQKRLQERYFPTLFSLWSVWPAVQLINFRFVPVEKRVLLVNAVGTVWSIYLSYIGNKKYSTENHTAQETELISTVNRSLENEKLSVEQL